MSLSTFYYFQYFLSHNIFLKHFKLSKYSAQLQASGLDNLQIIHELEEEDINELIMTHTYNNLILTILKMQSIQFKMEHIINLNMNINKLNTVNNLI